MQKGVVATILLTAAILSAEPVKDKERQALLAHFEMTGSWLADEVKSLSPAQQKFRPADSAWNVIDVIEHLAIAEPQYFMNLQDSLKVEPDGKKSEVSDAAIFWYGVDRSNRAKTGEARVPKGSYQNVDEALAAFQKQRSVIVNYAKTTQDDLRGHRLLNSQMDLYQWLLMISTHSQRHILQVREINANPNFPRK